MRTAATVTRVSPPETRAQVWASAA
jgi:hypothetical protein